MFNWTKFDAVVSYFAAQGKDIYYQIWGTPQSAVANLTHPWIGVPDQGGLYSSQVPDQAKLARFVGLVAARLTSLAPNVKKYVSTWNETKWGKPTCVVYGTLTGTFTVGDHIVGQTTGAGGTVKAIGAGKLTVLYDNALSLQTPFTNGEAVWKDGSAGAIRINVTGQTQIGYFQGSAQDAVYMQRTVYSAVKAVNPAIVVTTHDFEGGHSFENNWLGEFLAICAADKPFDMLAYHFYCYDNYTASEYVAGHFYGLQYMINKINTTLAQYGLSKLPRIASECGYIQGWDWYDKLNVTDKADVMWRVTGMLAIYGYDAVIWYSHESAFDGLPRDNPEIAAVFSRAHKQLAGATLSNPVALPWGNVAVTSGSSTLVF